MAAGGHLGYTKRPYTCNFATGLPIDVMFGYRVGFPAKLIFMYALLSRVTLASAGLSSYI